jgi:very-short-patch-repair endonuclease
MAPQVRSTRKLRKFTCVGCGKYTEKRGTSDVRYCSLSCYRSSLKPQRKTGANLKCDQCGSVFYRARSLTHDVNICSRPCFLLWHKRKKTVHTCKMCGGTFHWSFSRTASGKHNITYCSLKCRDADPMKKQQLIDMNVQQQTMKMSKLEVVGYRLLDESGIPYLRQHLIGDKFCVDAFVPELGTVIQFDGDYWHGNPSMFSCPDSRQLRRMRLDASQDAYMRACGFFIIRLWESEVYHQPDRVEALFQQLLAQLGRNSIPLGTDQI